jgi:two-component SAPR family response regulator
MKPLPLPLSDDDQAAFDSIFNRAADCHDAGEVDAAAALLRSLTILNPLDQDVWRALAACHEARGEDDVSEMLLSINEQIQELAS